MGIEPMKPIMASEVVKVLQERIEEHGDLPVYLPLEATSYHEDETRGDLVVCVGVNTWMNDEDKADAIMFTDPGWADAFGGEG